MMLFMRDNRKMNKKILDIAFPSIISNITVPLLGLVDTAIAGHLGAAAYIGAIAVGGMLFNMIYWLFGFLRMGTGGLTAQAFGAGLREETVRILLRALGVGLLIAVLLIFCSEWILQVTYLWIEGTDEVKKLAASYFRILIWAAPAVLLQYGFTGWFLGQQNARFPMWVAIVQNLVNIGVSLFFVVGCGWKVEGVAWGTFVAQYVALLLSVLLTLQYYRRNFVAEVFRTVWTRSEISRFFRVNRDIFFRTLCLVGVTVSFTSIGAAQGDVVLAANALLMQFFVCFSYVMDGFAYAGEAIGGMYFGAKDRKNYRLLVRQLFCWGTGLVVCFTLVYGLAGPFFLSLLTSNREVFAMAVDFLPYAVIIPLSGFMAFLYDGLFIGATETLGMLLAILVASLAFAVILWLALPTWGNHALWGAFLLYLFLRGAFQWKYSARLERKL